jgi:predicted nucleic acid-binding protein
LIDINDRWHQDPRVELVGEPRAAEVLLREAATPFLQQAGTRVIADCYLAGFAEAVGAHLVTFDRGLAEIARFRKNPVILLDLD